MTLNSNNELEFDFDLIVDRTNTSSVKWGVYHGRDIIPLWVADMDFKAPPAVIKALHERVDQDVFGYTMASKELVSVVQEFLLKTYHWKIEASWIVWLPGLVTGLNLCCRAVGDPGDSVLTTTPIYPPFLTAPQLSDRALITVPLRFKSPVWDLNFEEMNRAVTSQTKLFLFCNPYNPVGRSFSRGELETVAQFCIKHDLVVCSDEIHAGLILDDQKEHIPLASLNSEVAHRTITLMAPSKTYNIPGLGCSFAIIPNEQIRKKFQQQAEGIVPFVNVFGYVATQAAYRDGESWRKALIHYLKKNRDLVYERINQMPGLVMTPIEATYLAWIDARQLNMSNPKKFFEDHGVGLTDGAEFGAPGFLRLNYGCSRVLLEKALGRMQQALQSPNK